MSIEDDFDHLSKILEASRAAQAGQPDVLVFCLRGKEIQEILVALAEKSERDAEMLSRSKSATNVTEIRRRSIQPQIPAYPGSPEEMNARREAMLQDQTEALRGNAKSYRFLAAHVEEERFFRLSTQDLAFLGLVPQSAGYRMPFAGCC
jgi:hypothetical protein